ncbi:nogo-B receptor-like protein [Dinothrombium tinctorium]|uniref:ditrans,polycis-polyprenyl diphosphate synthase [(2E,6E)-farnesyldiphosphate specific] n=1 Tax=Dinothrombium tinctorium TaxID=1965070 RepID=A0A3S3NMB4_9ACAR|nr:nogo-B receptor-like protein [Dinothrombium tinctorium]RWS02268.1 nogo-B receptor-like protein [Dinothrombium tinctorium]RWS05979.1 nogo-B receptor-like protein [Dinothrombium tinctorium]
MSVEFAKRCVFALIYRFIHALYSLFEFFRKRLQFAARKHTANERSNFSVDKSFSKLPQHLAVIANCDHSGVHSIVDTISLIVYWCSLLEIEYITLYDAKGSPHFSALALPTLYSHRFVSGLLIKHKKSIESKIKQIQSNSKQKHSFTLKNGTSFKRPCFTLNNDIDASRLSKVTFISAVDGRQTIVQVTKDIASKMKRNMLNTVNPNEISTLIQEKNHFPDVDLAVILGSTPCVFSFPPWQLRVTEILTIQNHDRLEVEDFIEVISKYSKCQQRFGK